MMSKGINPQIKIARRSLKSLEYYLLGLKAGDRFVLGEVLTLIESKNAAQRGMGDEILKHVDTTSFSHTLRIGITGSPGAGKSTFIEALGNHLIDNGHKVAVLAVDPSSTKTKGSILGDKTRMSSLSTNESAFIRPTASANMLGGVAQATKESISICEVAGYDIVIIESVGVGQSETLLSQLVDVYALLLIPGGGDSIQGIKRGVVELADIIVINKNDGEQKSVAAQSKKDFAAATQLFHHEIPNWRVPVELCSAIEQKGIDTIWLRITEYMKMSKATNHFLEKRETQDRLWLNEQVAMRVSLMAEELFCTRSHLNNDEEVKKSIFERRSEVLGKLEEDFVRYKSIK